MLLAQARIGHDSYTVIGQGLIDSTLSLRAEERRGLFEDAAGIRPFQVQRSDAENRLKQTEQNLERLRDIVLEIEPRLAPLAEQARRAAEFSQLSAELHEVLLSWYSLQWRRLRTVSERAEQVEQEQAEHVQQLELALKRFDEQATTLRSGRQQVQSRIAEARSASHERNASVQKLERDLAVNEERLGGVDRQRSDFQQEERRLRERLIVLQKQLIDLEEQCDLADETVDEGSASLATLESQVAKAQKEHEFDERRLRNAQGDLIQVQARLGSSQTELGRVQKQLGERNRTLASRRESIANAQQNQRTLETRLLAERKRLDEARDEEQQASQRKQAVVRSLADAQLEMDRLKSTLAEAERQRRSLQDRFNMLKNWRQSLSGYSDGVRALLRAPAGKIPALLGPVPQLGLVPAGLETALEAAFGNYMQAVVVRSLADAQTCLRYLHEQGTGKAMLVWTERDGEDEEAHEVNLIQAQVEEQVLQRFLTESPAIKESIAGFAWKFVQCEPRYQAFFRRILHGCVVARDLQAARTLFDWALPLSLSSNSDLPFESVVTLKGEMLHITGWLSGGSGKDGAQGLLAHERDLRELPQLLENQKNVLDRLNTMLSEIQRVQEGRRVEQQTIDRELQKITSRLNEINKQASTSQREQERLQTELQLASSVEQQLASEVAGLEQEVVAAQERVRAHEKSQREMAGLLEELQIEMEERALTFRRQQDELGKTRTALALKRQEARSLRQQLTTQQQQVQELRSQVDLQVTRLKDLEQRKQTLQDTIVQHHAALAQARKSAETHLAELQKIEEQLAWIDQQIQALEKQRMQQQQAMTVQEALYRRSLLESQRAHDAVTALLSQLREELEIEDPRELANHVIVSPEAAEILVSESLPDGDTGNLSEAEETQLRKLRRRVETLRTRLKAMGGCDSNAPQLYEETRTRYEFLSTQISDMEQATLQLRTIIAQLDATMARQFEATFQAVNTRFREHFTTLFNGGSARLELLAPKADEESPAPSSMPVGIEVIVQPPGKKVQDLSLLSGGERALVSAALLFSLLEINPPPFCLLDEVDAALDKSNVTRFCDILKRLAQRTQFIVITHNRVTMTSAQVIYGVSMRDSISRLLSLRLEEVVAVGGDR